MTEKPLAKKKAGSPHRRRAVKSRTSREELEQVRQGEDQGQRVKTYMVISKPKRMSVKPGFVHIMGALRGGLKTASS